DRARPPEGGAKPARVEVSMAAVHRDTGREVRADGDVALPSTAGEKGWPAVAQDFDLPAGVGQARVVVRDPVTGALGSVSQRFEVPAAGGLRLSPPILTDRVDAGAGAGPPRPALTARRVFAAAGSLYVQFEVFGAARPAEGPPRVLAGLSLRTRAGR